MRFTLIPILLILFIQANAQQDIQINIIDYQSNQPVEKIEVTLKNDDRGYDQTQITDVQGRAIFRSVPAVSGYRAFVAENEDFLKSQSGQIDVRSNETSVVDMVLLSARTLDLPEVVLFAGGAGQINRTDAEVSFELTEKEIRALPVEGRDLTRVLFRLPNVSRATGFYPEAPNVSINGANSLLTSYLIDGMDNNERFLGGQKFAVPSGFAKNITVLTNNYSAEYGLTSNGVVNVTSRSGSNEFSGEGYVITRPGPVIDGSSPYAQRDLSGNAVKDGFQRYQAGVAFGGALIKNKTFYYVDLEHTTDLKDNLLNSPALGVAETVRGNNRFNYLSAKIDHQWSTSFRSSLRANLGLVNIERQGGGLEGGVQFPSAANSQDRNSAIVAWKNNYAKRNFSSETNLQYARFRWNYGKPLDGNASNPQVTVLNPREQTVAVLGHPGYIFDATENTVQFQQKFRWYLDKHTLKAGAQIISSDHQLFGGGNVNGNYRVKLTQTQLDGLSGRGSALGVNDLPSDVEVLNYNVELRPNSFGARQTVYSLYVEDQWAATDRLNLTLGLRYDYDNLSKGGAAQGDLDNISPRFNFNYKINTRSSLRGGYGIFYDKVPYAVYSDALQQNTTSPDYLKQLGELINLGILPADTDLDRITFDGNLGASADNVTYLNGPSPAELQANRSNVFSNERRILNPNGYTNPFAHQIALGYQLQIDDNKLFYVDLVHNRFENLPRLRNLNAVSEYDVDPNNVVVRSVEEADLTRPIPIMDGAATIDGEQVTGIARSIIVSEFEGISRYYAATFVLQKELGDDNYAYRVNYTLSQHENNTGGINFRAANGNDYASEYGPSINDRTHIINGIFNYFPTKKLSITLATLLQSGQPINRIPDALLYGTTDLNGDGASFSDAYTGNSDRSPGESRNSDRLPWSNNFDLGLQYDFSIGENQLELRADIFNLFNAANLSGYSNNATQSNQIQPGPASSGVLIRRNADAPRQFQFSLMYRW